MIKPKTDLEKKVLELYNAEENQLAYMIEPKGSVDYVDKDHVTTKEDLERIL